MDSNFEDACPAIQKNKTTFGILYFGIKRAGSYGAGPSSPRLCPYLLRMVINKTSSLRHQKPQNTSTVILSCVLFDPVFFNGWTTEKSFRRCFDRGAKMDLKKIFDNFVTKSRRLDISGAETGPRVEFFVEVRAPF